MLETSFRYSGSEELNLHYCGKRIRSPHHSYGPEARSHYLIVLICEGHGTLHSTPSPIALAPGKMLFMLPGERVHYTVNPDERWSISWIGVNGQFVDECCHRISVTPESPVLDIRDMTTVSNIFDKIYDLACRATVSDNVMILSLLYRFFSILLAEHADPDRIDYVTEARKMMDFNFDKDITVRQIAESLHIHPTYLSRIFRDTMHQSPKEYLIRRRLACAQKMLATDSLSVSEIAHSVGFTDPLYFSRLFREKIGQSPQRYRQSCIWGQPTKED